MLPIVGVTLLVLWLLDYAFHHRLFRPTRRGDLGKESELGSPPHQSALALGQIQSTQAAVARPSEIILAAVAHIQDVIPAFCDGLLGRP